MKVGLHRLVALAALCLGLAAATAADAGRGLTVPVKGSEAKGAQVVEQVELYGSSHALVVGIDNYNNGWPRLSMAVKDAVLVAEQLRRRGFDVTLKTDLGAADLTRAIQEFFVIKGEDPDARLFFWYAGHGHTLDGEGYLVPADAPRPSAQAAFKLSALPLRTFGIYVRQARSKHAFAVFDSCFSGTVFDSQRSMPPPAITRATTQPVRQFLTSGDANQSVSDDGTFRKLFLRALAGEERADANGDGYVTASEIGLFLGDRVTNLTQARQTPRYGKLRDPDYDRGDFVFALASAAAPPVTTPRAPAATSGVQPSQALSAEMLYWQSIKDGSDPALFQSYLEQYPSGVFAKLAKLKMTALAKRSAPKQRSTEPKLADFAGAWQTSYGRMTLTQNGDRVSGNYDYKNGSLQGQVKGNVLHGRWDERTFIITSGGEMEFTLSADGRSFTGRWRTGSSGGWTTWTGTKL